MYFVVQQRILLRIVLLWPMYNHVWESKLECTVSHLWFSTLTNELSNYLSHTTHIYITLAAVFLSLTVLQPVDLWLLQLQTTEDANITSLKTINSWHHVGIHATQAINCWPGQLNHLSVISVGSENVAKIPEHWRQQNMMYIRRRTSRRHRTEIEVDKEVKCGHGNELGSADSTKSYSSSSNALSVESLYDRRRRLCACSLCQHSSLSTVIESQHSPDAVSHRLLLSCYMS